jgi:hypothetical protein
MTVVGSHEALPDARQFTEDRHSSGSDNWSLTLSALKNHFRQRNFGGLFFVDTADQLALRFPTFNDVCEAPPSMTPFSSRSDPPASDPFAPCCCCPRGSLMVAEGDQGDGEQQEGDDHTLLHLRQRRHHRRRLPSQHGRVHM